MLCYRDKTWCSEKCNTECSLNLTPALKQHAEEWWNAKRDRSKWTPAPVATQSFKDHNNCPGYTPRP